MIAGTETRASKALGWSRNEQPKHKRVDNYTLESRNETESSAYMKDRLPIPSLTI